MGEASPAIKIKSDSIKILDYIFFLRPMLHPPVWTIVILGFFYLSSNTSSVVRLVSLLVISSAAASWAYIVNQISDIESDRINNKLHFLPQGIISARTAYLMAAIAFGITLVGGFLLGPAIGILFSIGLILGYIYSGKPFYAKNYPIFSTFVNGFAHGILPFLAGYVGAGGMLKNGILISIPYFFAVAAVFIGTTILDIPGDSRNGKITPGVALGIRRAIIMMTVCLALSFLLAIIHHDLPLIIVAALSMPFYSISLIGPNERRAVIAIKTSILLLSLAACVRFWPYAILLVGLFAATRLYYRKRFGMVYPSLT